MKIKKEMEFNTSIEQIEQDAYSLELDKNQSYLISYQEFIDFFNNKIHFDKHDVIIGTHLIYGWMPKILNLKNIDRFEDVVIILNEVKNGKLLNESELKILKNCINNSLVGTSKLLHFINPDQYAIWDRVVYEYLTGEKVKNDDINNYSDFLNYLKHCNILIQKPIFQKIKNKITDKISYEISNLRAIELIMFETQRKKNELCSKKKRIN